MWLTFWAGCADIGAAVASTMAVMITPASASRDVTATPSAAGIVASSLTCRFCQSKRKVINCVVYCLLFDIITYDR